VLGFEIAAELQKGERPMAKAASRRLSLGELQYIDAQISLAQERGLKLDDNLRANSDNSCCGAVTAEAKGKLVFSAHDREIFRKMADLESQIQSMPTLRQLVDARGELLREAKTRK
jgi:hypothetical protein